MRGHVPIMVKEITGFLEQAPEGLIVDGTAGGGGHLAALSSHCPERCFLAVERDPLRADALEAAFRHESRVTLHRGSYTDIPLVLGSPAAGALFDLGLSSLQLDDPERGFSHRVEGPLDMRFDTTRGEPLHRALRSMTEQEIADLIHRYGQEGRSRRIAREIRRSMPLETSRQLEEAVRRAVPGNPVKSLARVFQAFRIHINDELGHLQRLLDSLHQWLLPLARVAFLTFHSLEDRQVKLLFRDSPHFTPTDPPWLLPSREEVLENPRARAARLRTGVRVP